MPNARLLAIDFGTVRLGLAVADPETKIAFPLTIREVQGRARDAEYFRELVREEQIDRLVVGLPVHLDGREGQKAKEARAFGQWLTEVTGLSVIFWDERFTTVEAEHILWDSGLTHKKRKARRDQIAAQILLQSYLDAGCPEEQAPTPLDEPPADHDE